MSANANPRLEQGTSLLAHDIIVSWAESFLMDRQAQNVSLGTMGYYRKKLRLFLTFCEAQALERIEELTPDILRQYLIHLEQKGHNPGGVHAAYRTLKTFLRWYEQEMEPEGWRNPIERVKPPRLPVVALEPVALDIVTAMLNTCERGTPIGDRDRAILLGLLETGARASEFLGLDLADVNVITGELLIRKGKGGKPRMVYLGSASRKALRRYLRPRAPTRSLE